MRILWLVQDRDSIIQDILLTHITIQLVLIEDNMIIINF
jgi:hypothetical protein